MRSNRYGIVEREMLRFMSNQSDVVNLDRYLLQRDNLSDAQRRIAEYICEYPWDALRQTAAEIGAAVGASASTVVRFAQSVGFEGLAELQELLGRHVKYLLRSRESLERVKYVSEQLGVAAEVESFDYFQKIAQSEIANIQNTLSAVSASEYNNVVNELVRASSVYVLGLRGSLSLAVHFTSGMRYVRPRVFRLDNSGDDLADKISSMTSDDVLVAFSYSPYTSTTIKAVTAAKSLGAHVTTITDNHESPAAKLSDRRLVTHSPVWFSSTTGGSTALVNALVYSTAAEKKESVTAHVDKTRRLVAAMEEFELSGIENITNILRGDRGT